MAIEFKKFRDFSNYSFLENGKVFSTVKGYGDCIIKEFKTYSGKSTGGYVKVNLTKNKKRYYFYLHRIIAEIFIPNPENKPQVNHKDGNKLNNSVKNLEWVTASENEKHSYKIGIKSAKGRNAKLKKSQVLKIRSSKDSLRELAKKYSVSHTTIYLIKKRKNWKWL